MSFVAVAIGGAAVIGGVTAVVSGNKAAGAVKDSAAQTDATNRYIYDQTRADYKPWKDVGQGALYKLADMYGVPRPTGTGTATAATTGSVAGQYGGNIWGGEWGTGANFAGDTAALEPAGGMTAGTEGWQASPGYTFRRDEGIKAIERSAAARGSLRGGATMKSIGRYVDNTASSEYENYANRLAALAGVGQNATAGTAQAGQAYAGQQSATNMAAGQARASAYQNTGNAINSGVQNLASAFLYNKGYGGGGGGTGGTGYGGYGGI